MAEDREIYRVELDVADVEAKAQRVVKLLGDIQQKRSRGEDTRELEKSLEGEVSGLSQLITREGDATRSTEDLVKHKEKLGAVVRILGGQFSGMLGDLGSIIQLFQSGGKAAAAMAVSLAAMVGGSFLWDKLKESAAAYANELERIAKLERDQAQERMSQTEQVATMLEKSGVAGGAESVAARAAQMSREEGIDEDLARFGAVAAQVGGLDDDAMRRVMRGYLISGRSAQLTGNQSQNAAVLAQLEQAGTTAEAESFYTSRVSDTAEIVRARNAAPDRSMVDRLWNEMIVLALQRMRRTEGINETDANLMMRLSGQNVQNLNRVDTKTLMSYFRENYGFGDIIQQAFTHSANKPNRFDVVANEQLEGGTRTIGELIELLIRAQKEALSNLADEVGRHSHVTMNITNVGTAHLRGDSGLRPSPPSIAATRDGANFHKGPLP